MIHLSARRWRRPLPPPGRRRRCKGRAAARGDRGGEAWRFRQIPIPTVPATCAEMTGDAVGGRGTGRGLEEEARATGVPRSRLALGFGLWALGFGLREEDDARAGPARAVRAVQLPQPGAAVDQGGRWRRAPPRQRVRPAWHSDRGMRRPTRGPRPDGPKPAAQSPKPMDYGRGRPVAPVGFPASLGSCECFS